MSRATTTVEGSELLRAEFARVLGVLVEFRWSRAPMAVLAFIAVAGLDPTRTRCVVCALGAAYMVTVSWLEQRRFRDVGPVSGFIARNASLMAGLHLLLILLTGTLASPFLPLMVVFTAISSVALGSHPEGRGFRVVQGCIVVLLVGVQLLGWDQALTPAWMRAPATVGHTIFIGVVLAFLLRGAVRIGASVRRLFDGVLARTSAAREELLDAHRDQAEALTSLSGAIAHELKNPLASIKGLGALLARDLPDGKPGERLGVLRGEVDRMQAVLDGFLNFSRPAVPVVATVADVRALCDDVVALHEGLSRARGVRLGVTGGGTARVDVRKTRDVLINLVQNALDASRSGAAVVVAVEVRGDRLLVTVDDEGLGLDPDLGPRVFEAGVTTKAAGNGLGLTLARALARQQGGELGLENREIRGCRATLTLPAAGVS